MKNLVSSTTDRTGSDQAHIMWPTIPGIQSYLRFGSVGRLGPGCQEGLPRQVRLPTNYHHVVLGLKTKVWFTILLGHQQAFKQHHILLLLECWSRSTKHVECMIAVCSFDQEKTPHTNRCVRSCSIFVAFRCHFSNRGLMGRSWFLLPIGSTLFLPAGLGGRHRRAVIACAFSFDTSSGQAREAREARGPLGGRFSVSCMTNCWKYTVLGNSQLIANCAFSRCLLKPGNTRGGFSASCWKSLRRHDLHDTTRGRRRVNTVPSAVGVGGRSRVFGVHREASFRPVHEQGERIH